MAGRNQRNTITEGKARGCYQLYDKPVAKTPYLSGRRKYQHR